MPPVMLLASALAAVSVILVFAGVRTAVVAHRDRLSLRLDQSGRAFRNAAGRQDVALRRNSHRAFVALERPLDRFGWAERARKDLRKAEVHLHLSEFIAIRLLASVATVALIALVGQSPVVVVGAVLIGIVVWLVPEAYVKHRIARRQGALEGQLDAMLVGLAGSLRAGFSFVQACQMAVEQLTWPLKQEMQEMLEEVTLGASIDEALGHLAERAESYEVDITVNAVLVHRSTGGNLAEVLDSVARTIRDRRELRGHIMALTAQQRLSAFFVAGVPVLMAVFLSLANWQFMKPLFTTSTGAYLLLAGVVFDALGFVVMRRLTRIDF